MSLRFWLGFAVAAVMTPCWNASAQTNMLTLLTNGPTAKRLNIVFLSEGYTTTDLAHFSADARTMLNRMITSPPLNEYSNYFNAFAISVPSNQSGSDHYTPTTNLVDTFSIPDSTARAFSGLSRSTAPVGAALIRCSRSSCRSMTSPPSSLTTPNTADREVPF